MVGWLCRVALRSRDFLDCGLLCNGVSSESGATLRGVSLTKFNEESYGRVDEFCVSSWWFEEYVSIHAG